MFSFAQTSGGKGRTVTRADRTMSMYKTQQPETATLPAKENCAGCGRSLEQVRDEPGHQPEPNETESDRCTSRPRKYSKLRSPS